MNSTKGICLILSTGVNTEFAKLRKLLEYLPSLQNLFKMVQMPHTSIILVCNPFRWKTLAKYEITIAEERGNSIFTEYSTKLQALYPVLCSVVPSFRVHNRIILSHRISNKWSQNRYTQKCEKNRKRSHHGVLL